MKRLIWPRSRFNCTETARFSRTSILPLMVSEAIAFGRSSLLGVTVMGLTGLGLVGTGATIGATIIGLNLALAPSVQAYTTEDLLTVSWVVGEDYTALSRRAEMAARAMAQQRFDSDILLTRVIITVLGQNGGQTAPILELNVSRNEWRSRPDPQRWATYYRSSRVLLGFEDTPNTVTQPAGVTPAPVTPAPIAPAPGLIPVPGTITPEDPASDTTPSSRRITPPETTTPNPAAPGTQNQPAEPGTQNQTEPSPSGSASPPSVNIPATPPGQVGLPRSILR